MGRMCRIRFALAHRALFAAPAATAAAAATVVLSLIAVAAAAGSAPAYAQTSEPVAPGYRVVNLGTLPTRVISRARGISENGFIVGEAWTNKATKDGWFYSSARAFRIAPVRDASGNPISWYEDSNGDGINDLMTDPGTFGGDYASGRGVNNAGDVVGQAQTKGGGFRAFLFRSGQLIDLFRKDNSIAKAINDALSPQITGEVQLSRNSGGAFLWQNGQFSLLDFTSANAINNASSVQVVGLRDSSTSVNNGCVLWTSGVGVSVLPPDVQEAYGINDSGWVLGRNGILWIPSVPNGSTGSTVLLGSLGGGGTWAFDVNNPGQVVGSSATTDGMSHAFLWDSVNGMQDLNLLLDSSGAGWTLGRAYAINDGGYIVGEGSYNGVVRAFLLIPLP